MKIKTKAFRISGGRKIRLTKLPTKLPPLYQSEKHYKKLLGADLKELRVLQERLFVSNAWSVLLIFQAMDAAGKDGAINHVLRGVNPQGCEVHSFKHPSAAELEHDFLWRTTCRLPGRGRIGVFNRSYYEEVLIVRVHPEILLKERVPATADGEKSVWEGRFRSIVDFEAHLHRNGTRIIKFFLHLSKAEQRRRLLARIDEPEKNWKASQTDINERKFWKQYQQAYQDCLNATSTKHNPWHVVPADDKYNARLIISRIVVDAMKALRLRHPPLTAARKRELREIRRRLAKD